MKKEKRDPLGKQAIFWRRVEVEDGLRGDKNYAKLKSGRLAFFSDISKRLNISTTKPLTVTCSNCHEQSEVDLSEFLVSHLPLSLWIPFRNYSHFATCPSCKRRAWLKVQVTLLAKELKNQS